MPCSPAHAAALAVEAVFEDHGPSGALDDVRDTGDFVVDERGDVVLEQADVVLDHALFGVLGDERLDLVELEDVHGTKALSSSARVNRRV